MPISTQRASSASSAAAWMRWMPFWHGLFYVMLVLATGVDLLNESHTWQHTGEQLGLSLTLSLWYGICVVRSPLSWQRRPLLIMCYLIIGWTLWFGLTALAPVYLFVLAGLYPQVFILPPLPGKILGAFLLTALSAWRQVILAGGINGNLFLMLAVAVSGTIMALLVNDLKCEQLLPSNMSICPEC